ncbi:MAG: DinB family protein [Chloroflexi bacterium]|nr:DinB family protein [Chloroflexota bacterium]
MLGVGAAYNLQMGMRIVLLQALAATPNELALALERAAESGVGKWPSPEQWSAADVVAHLIDVESQYLKRLQRVVGEERPYLPSIHPNPGASAPTSSATELMESFSQARVGTLGFLQGLTRDDWGRTAVHESWGEMNLHTLVQRLVNHDNEHLSQMATIDFNKEQIKDE